MTKYNFFNEGWMETSTFASWFEIFKGMFWTVKEGLGKKTPTENQ